MHCRRLSGSFVPVKAPWLDEYLLLKEESVPLSS